MSESFNRANSYWFDDDKMSQANNDDGDGDDGKNDDKNDAGDDDGNNNNNADDGNANANANDDANNNNDDDDVVDDYFKNDDDGANNNDDGGGGGDDGNYNNGNAYQSKDDDDPYYTVDDDNRRLIGAAPGELEKYRDEFWRDFGDIKRALDQDNQADDIYGLNGWNLCEQIYKYGVWCDEQCRALDTFRVDEWSKPDIFLLVTMCAFMAAMMLLVLAKRLKAAERAQIYGDDSEDSSPGLPPICMALLFVLIIGVVAGLAKLKFVNETLVFAVVTCVLLFIYMLKLTLFETKRSQLLPPAHLSARRTNWRRRLFD